MMNKKDLEQLLVKFEDYLPKVSASHGSQASRRINAQVNKKRPGRPKKYDDRLVMLLIALREKYDWSLRELERRAKDILPKGIEIPDFSSIHYRIRKMKEYIDEIKPKLIKLAPDIEARSKKEPKKEVKQAKEEEKKVSKSASPPKAKAGKKTTKSKSKR